MPDGPGKSLWGAEQRAWLQRTILESDAVFKVIVSPTPMVGPDHPKKRDNHADPKGFMTEGREFFEWLKSQKVENLYIVCGDRHWQYHSIHPTGYQEFSCGPLCEKTAVKKPPQRADIRQPYTKGATGGFLIVRVLPDDGVSPRILFEFYNEKGQPLYVYQARPGERAP